MKQIAIIGAGMAGLTLAHLLKSSTKVTVLEKSRGLGGRMSTRYAGEYEFDHGVQFFTIKNPLFAEFMKPLIEHGIIKRWDARFAEIRENTITKQRQWNNAFPHYVGAPRMNVIGKHMAQGIDVQTECHVAEIEWQDNKWQLYDKEHKHIGSFDWVISTAPAEQARALLPAGFAHHKRLDSTHMLGCYTLMLGLPSAPTLAYDAAVVKNMDISWIATNSSKPGRPEGFSLVVQATNRWAQAHMEDDIESVKNHMMQELEKVINQPIALPDYCTVHRWRYANIDAQNQSPYIIDTTSQLAACGDWCIKGRVESAFISAFYLAKELRAKLEI